MSAFARLTSQITEHLNAHPENALRLYTAVVDAVRSAGAAAPAIEIRTGEDPDDDGAIFFNPRSGEEDVLVAIDSSLRATEADADGIDPLEQRIQIDYNDTSDYEGLLYVTASDVLPVSLPATWKEG